MGTRQRTGNEVTSRAWVQLKFCFHFFIFSFPVLVTSFSNAQTKEALSGKKTARYDLCSARPTDHLPFCIDVAKLRAKSLFLSIILLEVLFVSERSKSNKKLLVP